MFQLTSWVFKEHRRKIMWYFNANHITQARHKAKYIRKQSATQRNVFFSCTPHYYALKVYSHKSRQHKRKARENTLIRFLTLLHMFM